MRSQSLEHYHKQIYRKVLFFEKLDISHVWNRRFFWIISQSIKWFNISFLVSKQSDRSTRLCVCVFCEFSPSNFLQFSCQSFCNIIILKKISFFPRYKKTFCKLKDEGFLLHSSSFLALVISQIFCSKIEVKIGATF